MTIRLLTAMLVTLALLCCKNKPQAFNVSEDDSFEVQEVDPPKSTGDTRPAGTQQAQNNSATAAQSERNPSSKGSATSPSLASSSVRSNAENQFWSKPHVYFFDQVGGMGDAVYEAIKGQPYYANTVLLVYATDELMVGTSEYQRIEQTMESTRLDDRIFIWVHFDEDKNVKFVRKLISDNIKGDMPDANHIL